MLSDERAKTDITKVGEKNGFNLYRFRYVGGSEHYVGVLAQEVLKTRPDAVLQGEDGYLRVDYPQQ